MNNRILIGALTALLCGAAIASVSAADPSSTPSATAGGDYVVAQQFPVGGNSGWDFVTVDSQARRVYLTNSSRVVVLDADSGALLGEVVPIAGAHGVAVVAEQGKGFVTNGKNNTVSIFDLKTFKITSSIKTGTKPDALVYDPASKRLLVCNGNSGDVTVINPAALDQPPSTIPVGGKLEVAVADGKGHVYVNIEDKSEVVAIDTKTMKVDAHWPLAPGEEPTGLALDPAHRLLFAGCANEKMVVLNADTGKVVTTLPIGKGVDGVEFDAAAKVAISANGGSSNTTVVSGEDAASLHVQQTLTTLKGARTLAVDEKTHRIYLPCMLPGKDGAKAAFGVLVLQPKSH